MSLSRDSVTASDADITLAELSNTFRAAVSELMNRPDWHEMLVDLYKAIDENKDGRFVARDHMFSVVATPRLAYRRHHIRRLSKEEFSSLLTLMFQVGAEGSIAFTAIVSQHTRTLLPAFEM